MTQPFYQFYSPVKIIAGQTALEHIPFEINALGCTRPMVISDQGARTAGQLALVETLLALSPTPVAAVFDEVPNDCNLPTAQKAADIFRDKNCDQIIAVGAGNVLDTAKIVNMLVSDTGRTLLELAGAHNIRRALKPLFVIPTTSGSGSEVQMATTLNDLETGSSMSFQSHYLLPHVAVIDPRMTAHETPTQLALAAMNTLAQAVEAYTCLGCNPMSDAYATTAIHKISGNLLAAIDSPNRTEIRVALAEASVMAAIASSNSHVGMVHALACSIGAECNLPHSMCVSILLPYVLEYNRSVKGNRIGDLLLPLAGPEVYAATPQSRRASRAIQVIILLRDNLFQRCQIPRTLQETGQVELTQLDAIADRAFNDQSIIFNPKESDTSELRKILLQAWGAVMPAKTISSPVQPTAGPGLVAPDAL